MNKIYSQVWNKELGQLVVASEFAKSDSTGVVQGEGGAAPLTRSLLAVVFASLFAVAGYGPAAFAQEWTVTDGATVGFQGDSNINVSVMPNGADATVEINLAPDLVVDSVTTGDTVMNDAGVAVGANVVLGTSGLSITGGPSVTLAGIDAGNTVITNVAAGGNASDAVNFGQLQGVESSAQAAATAASVAQSTADNALTAAGNAQTTADAAVAAAGAGWDVSADSGSTANIGSGGSVAFSGDSNISVAQSGGDDAGAIDITLNPDLNVTSVTAGNTTVNNDGLTITGGPSVTASGIDAGDTKLTGLANGTVSADSTDAITGQQLHNVLFEGGSAFGVRYFRANSTADDAVAAGAEAVAIGPNTRAEGAGSFAAGDGAETTETGEAAIAIGQNATAGGELIGGEATIAIGRDSSATGTSAAALGDGASAGGGNATALGAGAVASGGSGVAVGDGAVAAAQDNISIGAQAGEGTAGRPAGDWVNNIAIGAQAGQGVEGQRNVAMGSSAGSGAAGNDNISLGENAGGGRTGDSNISIGRNVNVGGNTERGIGIGENATAATDGVAIGFGANAAGVNGMALGRDAQAQGSGVALGQGSRADSGYIALGVGSAALSSDVTGSSVFSNRPANTAAVSVGNTATGQTRRIVNVEDGANDTDAVNVRQLRMAVEGIDLGDIDFADGVIANLQDQIDNSLSHYVSINDGDSQTGNWANDGASAAMSVAIGPDASTTPDATNATAIGSDVTAQGSSSVVLGHDVQAISANSVAIGSARTEARDVSGVAIGTDSQSRGMNSIVIGTRSESDDQDGNNVQNSIVIGTDSVSSAREGIVIGRDSLVNAERGMAQGDNAQATAADAMASGTRSRASGTSSQASGTDAHASGTNAIATGTGSRGHATNGVAMGTGATSGFLAITPEEALRNHGSIAIGDTSRADDLNAMALGVEAQARAESATAIGDSAVATEDAEDGLAVGSSARVTAQNASAFGRGAEAVAEDALAVGSGARAAGQSASAVGHGAEASAMNASAFGQGARALHQGSVALGSGAETAAAVGTASYTVDRNTYNFAGTTPVATVSVGTLGQERTITNVAAGRISAQSTDAINGSQLYSTNQAVDALADDLDTAGQSVAAALGGTSSYNPETHTVTAGLSVQGNNFTNVQDALTYVGQGWNVSVGGETGSANVAPGGQVDFSNQDGNINIARSGTDLTFNLDDDLAIGNSITVGDTVIDGDSVTTTNLTVEGETRLGDNFVVHNNGNVTYNGAEIATQDDGLSFAGNTGGNISKTLGDNTPLTISGGLGASEASTGANLRVDSDGNQLNLVMARDLTDLDSITIKNGPVISNTGINMGDTRITNLAAGEAGTDAVNVSQLEAVEAIANAGWNVLDAAGNEANIGPDGELTFVAGNENLVVGLSDDTDDAGVMEITLADNIQLSEDGSIAVGDGTDGSTLDVDGLTVVDADGNETTVGADGTAVTDVDGNRTDVGAGTITVADAAGATVIGGNQVSVAGSNSTIVIDGDAGTIGGLTNTTFDPDAFTSGQAATEDQLSQIHDVATAGWNLTGSGADEVNIGPNGSVDFQGDQNITVAQTGEDQDGVIEVTLNRDLDVDSITAGDTTIDGTGVAVGDDVRLGDTGLVIGDADGPRFTNDGISAGNQVITNVAPGQDGTDAVNMDQLEAGRTKYYSVNDNGVVQGNYDNDGATGVNALAAGVNASAVGDRSVAVGAGAQVRPHPAGVANPDVDGPNVHDAVAIGTNAIVGNQRSMALGTGAQANKRDSIAIGTSAQVRWDGSASHNLTAGNIAIGTRAYTGTGSGSATVVGTGASADAGNIQTAVGAGATVRGNITTAIGAHSIAYGDTSAAVGVRSQASGYDSIAFGTDSVAGIRGVSGTGTVLTTNAASAVGVRSVAQGGGSTAVGTGAHVFGNGSGAISSWVPTDPRIGRAENSDASFSIIGGTNNFAVGNRNVIGDSSEHNVALGSDIKIGASGASMERESVTVNGVTRHYYTPTFNDAVAIQNAVAVGQAASVEASNSVAIGASAVALNEGDVALGAGSVTAAANPTSEGTVGGITYGEYAGNTPESVVSVGAAGAERQVTNVAAGRISEDSTDAINGSQLFATQTVIGNVAGSVVNVFGGNAELGDDGTITMTDIGGTGENTIHDAIKTANDTANMGWHVAVGGEGASDGNNVGPGGLVDFSNDDGNIVISRDGTDLAFNLAENIDLGENGSLTTGNTVVNNDGLTVEDEDGNVNTVAADGTTVADADGNTTAIGAGTVAVTDGTGTTTIGGNAISVGGANPILISGDTGTIGGLQNQTIGYQGFADGSGRAATEEQLAQVNDTANMGWNISAQGGNGTNVGPGGSVDLSNTDGNIVIAKEDDSNDVTFDLADDLVIGNSITAGDTYIDTTGVAIGADVHLGHTGLVITGGPSVTVAGIDAGNLVITNVAPGEISATSTDAINGSQLHGMGDSIVNVIGGNAELNPDGTITTSDIGGTGHDNIDDAIRAANDAANAGWTATDADGNAANIGPNGSVAFTGDGNISVAQTGEDNNGQVEITLNRDLDVDSITAGNTVIDTDGVQVGDNVHLGDTGLVIEGGPSVTTDGIDAGGSTLTNVAAGVNDTDAVNVGQLNQVAGDVNDLGDRMDVVEGDVADLQAGATGPFQVSQEAPLVPPTPTGANSAAGGSGADASGDNATALGNQAVASGENSTAVGQGAQATHDNSVALGQGSATTVGAQSGYDAAYVGSSDSAGEVNVGNRTISGVAPGVAGTDAVNVNQLNAGVNHAVVTANEYTDQRVNQVQSDVWHLHGRVDDLEKSINSGVATAMAMRQAPYVAGATTYFAGFGAYKDQGALGVSMRRTADNGRWSLEGGFSANRDGAGGYIGVSGVLGSK